MSKIFEDIDAIFNPPQNFLRCIRIYLRGDRKPGFMEIVKLSCEKVVRISESKHGGIW